MLLCLLELLCFLLGVPGVEYWGVSYLIVLVGGSFYFLLHYHFSYRPFA